MVSPPMERNKDSILLHSRFFGIGVEKMASRVFRWTLFIANTSTGGLGAHVPRWLIAICGVEVQDAVCEWLELF